VGLADARPMIRVDSLIKTYQSGHPPAVDGVSFTVVEGAWYTLLGPSGCGKTTTLRCVAGLERPESGTIELGGVVVVSGRSFVPTHRRDIGMVFQSYAVWPHMTVFDNAAFPLQVARRRLTRAVISERVARALELVGLDGLESRMATQLSGGQQQRLSVARALIREPSVLLLDEPLSNLDAKLRERMRGELRRIQKQIGITTLFVTHDQVEALSLSDRVAVMRDGHIIQEGEPREIYREPANEFVAGFIGSSNLLEGHVRAGDGAGSGLLVETAVGPLSIGDAPVSPGSSVVVAIRPEDVVLHRGGRHAEAPIDAGNLFPGTVELSLFSGTSVDYYLRVGEGTVHARVGSRIELAEGHRVHVELDPAALRLFPLDAGLTQPGPAGGDAAHGGRSGAPPE
jgi:iron(III) transport system ATP-binding protein